MVEAIYPLGRAYVKTGRAEKAIEMFEKVVRLAPDHETARCALAGAFVSLGRIDEASAALRESIRLRKGVDSAYSAFARMQKFASEPAELNEIFQELERGELKPVETYQLHYAAGKILNDLKRYDEAFDQFDMGNRASGETVDLNDYRQFVQGAIQAFTPELMRSKVGLGDATEVPVFILGMPRSGTTLTEQICSSHPSVAGAGELINLRRVVRRSGFGTNSLAELGSKLAAMTPQQSRTLAAEYLRDVLKLAPRASRIVDKMPHNFEMIGFIALFFPKAR